ncbi:sortase [Streptococcus pneumoniae]
MSKSRYSRKKSVKKKKNPFILLLIFLVGLAVAMYPLVSRYYYRIESNEVIKEFDETVSQMDKAELEERWRLAQAFNATLKPSEILDPFFYRSGKETGSFRIC